MELIIALVASILPAYLLRKPLKHYATVFYIAAAAVDVLMVSQALFGVSREFASMAFPYFARCLVGFALLSLVMYIGVLPENSKPRRALMPVRGELSVVAAILVTGHVVNYLSVYLTQILSGFAGMPVGMIGSFIVSSLLIVLLIVLTSTSLNTVKARMRSETWKATQRWAYVFYGLTYLHLLLVLAPTISQAGQRSALSIAIYTAIVLAYLILRVAKHLDSRKAARRIENG